MSIYKSNQQIVDLLCGHAYGEAEYVEVRAVIKLMLPGLDTAFRNGDIEGARMIFMLAKQAVCPVKYESTQEMFQRLHDYIVVD